jgi:hypothetical protein
MQINVLYFGEQVSIPHTPFELGVSFISVWIGGAGFTSASNDVGTIGYVYLNTPAVEVPVDQETEDAFRNLHGRVVRFEITPSKFIRDGGIARFKLTLPTNGDVAERSVEFTASGCRGVSITTGTVSFSTEMLQLDRSFAEVADSITDDEMVAIVDAAPEEGDEIPA